MPAPPLTTKPPTAPPTYPATREGVTAALTALGDSPDRVADTLAATGRLGEPGESRECPVAVYLHDVLSPTWPVSIAGATVTVWTNGHRVDVVLPGPVRRFVAAFDLGAYRFLYPVGYVDPEAAGRPVDPLARATAPYPDTTADTHADIRADSASHAADTRPDTRPDTGAAAVRTCPRTSSPDLGPDIVSRLEVTL